jgi:hypothetical protein
MPEAMHGALPWHGWARSNEAHSDAPRAAEVFGVLGLALVVPFIVATGVLFWRRRDNVMLKARNTRITLCLS